MAYVLVDCLGTQYSVDWPTVERLCRSYWQSNYQFERATATSISESTWYNPFSWSMPSIRTVDVPWDKVRDLAARSCAKDMADYRRASTRDMRGVALDLMWKLEQTARYRRAFRDYLRDIQSLNMGEIDKAVDDYDGLIEAAKFVRNTSADVVAIGSTIATGGAAAGLLGASSAMKGWGKYQDTGSVGAATLHGAGSLVLGAFKVGGAKLGTAEEFTLIIAQGSLETSTSLLAGDTFASAIEKGTLKVAAAGATQVIFSPTLVKPVFERMPIPLDVKRGVTRALAHDAGKIASDMTKQFAESKVEGMLGSAVKSRTARHSAAPRASKAPRSSAAGLIDAVPVEQVFLLHLAIINMRLGAGHGW